MSNENSTGLNHFALYQQGITSFMQPLRTSFSRLDFDTSCHIWWTDTDAKILSFSFSPKKLLAILHDITSPNSSCLQLNENSHCALTSCVACQGKSYPFTCKRTFSSILFWAIMCRPLAGTRHVHSHVHSTDSSGSGLQHGYPCSPLSRARLLCMEGRVAQIPYR